MNSIPFDLERWQPWLRRAGTRAPGIITLGLVLVLAHIASELTWEILGGRTYTAAPAAVPATPRTRQSGSGGEGAATVDNIVQRNLFGVADDDDTPVAEEIINAPETRLNLTLKGIYAAGVPETSRAIIAEGDSDEEIYAIGDPIPGNATIENIYMDRVIIRRGGSLEALRLPRAGENNGSSPPAVTRRASGEGTDLLALREELLDNPERITDLVRFRPVYRNAEFQGYRIYPGREQEVFRELGLKPGDLVRQINGVSLDDPQGVMGLVNELPDTTSVNVTLERRGETEDISISLDR